MISCLCVICAFYLLASNRTCCGNATGVPRQKKFTSKASGWYYNSLIYFLTMPLSLINALHPFRIGLIQTLKLHQMTSLPQKCAKNYSYLPGLTLSQVSPP